MSLKSRVKKIEEKQWVGEIVPCLNYRRPSESNADVLKRHHREHPNFRAFCKANPGIVFLIMD